MAYIAPEVISRQGYTFTPDWWSLGVTLYEVMFRVRPYNGRSGQELMANIDKGDVPGFFRDPKGRCSPMCIDVLRGVSVSPFPHLACSHMFAVQAGGEGQGCAAVL